MKIYLLIILLVSLSGCGVSRKVHTEDIEIKFLDEYVLKPTEVQFEETKIGGLSGIDYFQGNYYLVCDDSSLPRIYKLQIDIFNNKIDIIRFSEVLKIEKTTHRVLDLEGIRVLENGNFIVSSEGLISNQNDPGIYIISTEGKIENQFKIPAHFTAEGKQHPRNNGVFEGLSKSADGLGYWVATETVLEKDGSKSKVFPTKTPVRITKYDLEGNAVKEFAYNLDGIAKLPINYFAVNGAVEIIEYEPDQFLIMERSYSAGYGSHGNTIKIFSVNAENATNILNLEQLKGEKYRFAEKQLRFNFKKVKKQLTNKIIDNIEGMTLGPKLENGQQSLILVSDNNFNSFVKQLNQFILLQIKFKK
ncbi:esterase-like activity of phytase family protein [Gramella sp. AN32]|uniref:Esterase-like activity of phytase family protein n=1 Tax=Christiangramia antarctica TaxID=2058158 RepID=A0ABW5X732_9FLAO|nr:esterase-like activity of phytase family protein [Gramella sp. AN32]MCM4154546.1 hypothetical protein [Gramella sp. AN32]